jgi:serine protease Do
MEENGNSIRKNWSLARAFIVALALFLATGAGFGLERAAFAQQQNLPTPADLSRTFVGIAKQVKPAVVSIDTTEERRASGRSGLSIPGLPPGFGEEPKRQRGTGSGVIISADGYILTNNHVAGNATKLVVKLSDGREFRAKLVGADPETDLAVIKIEAQGLPFARLGDSDKVEQGEWVIALGSPFGLQQTMTAGIVSALGRDLGAVQQFTNFIQTDASINPGNSGGPLVNMSGEVIGINSMIYSRTGGSEGVGFAIPSALASKVYGQLVQNGRVTRAFLGVQPMELTPALARSLKYTGTQGILIRNLSAANSPAAKSGLRSGDIITEVDGKAIKTPKQLTEVVADLPVGKQVQVKFVRDGVAQTANVVLAERPKQTAEEPEENPEEEPDDNQLGASVLNITPQMVMQLKLKVSSGVLVNKVQADSLAFEGGLREGDVICKVNGKTIASRQDWITEVAASKNEKELVLQIMRGGRYDYITISLD